MLSRKRYPQNINPKPPKPQTLSLKPYRMFRLLLTEATLSCSWSRVTMKCRCDWKGFGFRV